MSSVRNGSKENNAEYCQIWGGTKSGRDTNCCSERNKEVEFTIHYDVELKFMLMLLAWQNYEDNDYNLNVMFSRGQDDSIGNKSKYVGEVST